MGANSLSHYQIFTHQDFANFTELQSRARAFLRRELLVFTFLDNDPVLRGGSRQYLMEYIVTILKLHDAKGADGKAEDLVSHFLGRENAKLLLHELQAWLRSPFSSLADWDGFVQYAEPAHVVKSPSANSDEA